MHLIIIAIKFLLDTQPKPIELKVVTVNVEIAYFWIESKVNLIGWGYTGNFYIIGYNSKSGIDYIALWEDSSISFL